MNEHATILMKGKELGVLRLLTKPYVENEPNGIVSSYDSRKGIVGSMPFLYGHDALEFYQQSVHTSVEREWQIVYKGKPLYG